MTTQPQIACPRCMPPGDPCCPYCGGTYGVDAPAPQPHIPQPASPLPWRWMRDIGGAYSIIASDNVVVATGFRRKDAAFIVALANAAARPDAGEVGR